MLPNARPRVFVPQEPLKRDPTTGEFGRMMDLSPARAFGEVVFIFPPGRPPLDPDASLPVLRAKLVDFGPNDFIIPVGSPTLIAWASVIAARASGGALTMLVWHGHERRYEPITVNL